MAQYGPVFRAFQEIPDPLRNSEEQLLQRPDVQRHLVLDMKQKRELDELQSKSQAEIQQQFQQNRGLFRNRGDMTDEERQQARDQAREQRQQFMTSFQAEQDKALQGILTPEQYKRLKELDLQWRGPLALADAKLSAPLQLTQEEQTTLQKTLQDYRTAQQQARNAAMSGLNLPFGGRRGGQNQAPDANAQPPAPPELPSPDELQERLNNYRKDVEKARKAAGEAVLAALTPEQQGQWKQMTGAPFIFRKLD
jgi:hypothetical protein